MDPDEQAVVDKLPDMFAWVNGETDLLDICELNCIVLAFLILLLHFSFGFLTFITYFTINE